MVTDWTDNIYGELKKTFYIPITMTKPSGVSITVNITLNLYRADITESWLDFYKNAYTPTVNNPKQNQRIYSTNYAYEDRYKDYYSTNDANQYTYTAPETHYYRSETIYGYSVDYFDSTFGQSIFQTSEFTFFEEDGKRGAICDLTHIAFEKELTGNNGCDVLETITGFLTGKVLRGSDTQITIKIGENICCSVPFIGDRNLSASEYHNSVASSEIQIVFEGFKKGTDLDDPATLNTDRHVYFELTDNQGIIWIMKRKYKLSGISFIDNDIEDEAKKEDWYEDWYNSTKRTFEDLINSDEFTLTHWCIIGGMGFAVVFWILPYFFILICRCCSPKYKEAGKILAENMSCCTLCCVWICPIFYIFAICIKHRELEINSEHENHNGNYGSEPDARGVNNIEGFDKNLNTDATVLV